MHIRNQSAVAIIESLQQRVLFVAEQWEFPDAPSDITPQVYTNVVLTSRGTLGITPSHDVILPDDWSPDTARARWKLNLTVRNHRRWGASITTGDHSFRLRDVKRIVITTKDQIPLELSIDPDLPFAAKITGSLGHDRINGGSRPDVIDGGSGNDRINGGDGNDSITGGAGNDRINGEDGYDLLDGGSSRDIICGGAGMDSLLGGGGNDHLDGGRATDVMHGGAGNDTFAAIDTFGNHDAIFGERGIDQLVNSNEDDLFDPGSQTDR